MLRPLTEFVGAEVTGFDPYAPITEQAARDLRAAMVRHHMLLIRAPELTQDQQIAITRIFGSSLNRNSYDGSMGKEAYFISNNRPDGVLPTGEIEFHHDHSFYAEPLKIGLLYAIEVPASGSRTRFRSAVAHLDLLSEAMRRTAEAVQCFHFFSYDDNYSGRQDPTKVSARAQSAWHPLVWADRDSAAKALFMARITIVDYKGIGKAEGDALIEEAWQIGEAHPEITYTHDWRTGDLVLWNNMMTAHARLPFQSSEPRTLRRTSAI